MSADQTISKAMGLAILGITIAVLPLAAHAQNFPPDVAALIQQFRTDDGLCRGLSPSDPRMQPGCDHRAKVGAELQAKNWCFGKKGQPGMDYRWHVCGPDSVR